MPVIEHSHESILNRACGIVFDFLQMKCRQPLTVKKPSTLLSREQTFLGSHRRCRHDRQASKNPRIDPTKLKFGHISYAVHENPREAVRAAITFSRILLGI
jgi:hypothetical protein